MSTDLATLFDDFDRGKLSHRSRTQMSDVIFRDALAALAAQHPDRLKVIHTLTREPDRSIFGPQVRAGRVDLALLREAIPSPTECLVYVCGPGISKLDVAQAEANGTKPAPRFLETVLSELKALGVPNGRIKREFYG